MAAETYITKTGLHKLSISCVRVGVGTGEVQVMVNGETKHRLPVEAARMVLAVSVPYHLKRGDHVAVSANASLQPHVEAVYQDREVIPLVLSGSEAEFKEWCLEHQLDPDNAYQVMQVLYPMDLAALEAVESTWLVLAGSWRRRLAHDAGLRKAVEYWLGRPVVETVHDWRRCVTRWLVDPCQAAELVVGPDGRVRRTNKAGIIKFRHRDILDHILGNRLQVGGYTLSYLTRDREYQYWTIIAPPQGALRDL